MTDETVEEIKRRKMEALQRQEDASTPSEPIPIRDASQFETVLDDYSLVLVDCHAEWCGPCQQLKPIVARIAQETEATVATVDIDAHQSLVANWNIRSVPTLLLFADGTLVERLVGVQPFEQLRQLLHRYEAP